jgi:hypothetical protein
LSEETIEFVTKSSVVTEDDTTENVTLVDSGRDRKKPLEDNHKRRARRRQASSRNRGRSKKITPLPEKERIPETKVTATLNRKTTTVSNSLAAAGPMLPPESGRSKPMGSLVVGSPDDGSRTVSVFVDGRARGNAPVSISLTPGLHEVFFVDANGRSLRMVSIKAGKVKKVKPKVSGSR